jgi:hypothetical protein
MGKSTTRLWAYNATQQKIVEYLLKGIREGKHYFKSKHIAQDLGLSSKEVGVNLGLLARICPKLQIERWSYSNSTTWRIEISHIHPA